MEALALVLGAFVAIAAVVFVARPFLREPSLAPEADRLIEPDEAERRRLSLVEERDRALAALKELEFDHRTGAISDADYRALVGPLRRHAAEALRALDAATGAAGSSRAEPAPGESSGNGASGRTRRSRRGAARSSGGR